MVVVVFAAQLALVSAANAEPPNLLFKAPVIATEPGSGAGEFDNPRGMGANRDNGRTYIADLNNARISEYTAWGRFVKAWGWGVGDGAAEMQTCGPVEPEESPDPTLCQAGIAGSGKGQFNHPLGVAVDPMGSVYVFDRGNARVQKFSPAGAFLLMFGGDVNQTKVEAAAPTAQRNVCPVDPGDVCKAGVSGEEPSQLSGTFGNYIAYTPAGGGGIVVGDTNGIEVFNLDGTHREKIPFSGALSAFAGQTINALAVDEDGNIYFSVSGLEDVYKISPVGEPLDPGKPGESEFKVPVPSGIAIDIDRSVYAIHNTGRDRILKFDADGTPLVPTQAEAGAQEFFPYIPFQGPELNGIATNVCQDSEEPGNLYASFFSFADVAYVNAYGTGPIGCEFPPLADPEITEQFATSVGRGEATVKAKINPRFWPDATYEVEYGMGKCSEGGCSAIAPVPPALLTGRSVHAPMLTGGVILEDLKPDTTYNFRFVSQSGGGGPVYGIDPDGPESASAKASFEEGLEGTFTTFAAPSASPRCPNDLVRSGPSKELPDCRAYEMVSPIDKAGGDAALWRGRNAIFPEFLEMHISAPSGERFTYSSSFAFEDPEGASFTSQYLAERGLDGWNNKAISPVQTLPTTELAFGNDFRGFSENLCQGWVLPVSVALLDEKAIPKFHNLYRRRNCTESPSYEALTTAEPVNRTADDYRIIGVRGFSEDGTHTVFMANGQLEGTDAPDLGETDRLIYESTEGQVRFVCYLPGDTPNPGPCAAGTMGGAGDVSNVHNAVSEDGSRIFWTAFDDPLGFLGIPGQIYVRVNGTETRHVSTAVDPGKAWYWTASEDGSKAVFAFAEGPHKDELYEIDVDSETPTLIAGEVDGPMGASEDATRIYFSGREDLDDGGPATAGEHNLYLYDASASAGEQFSFIMELPAEDTAGSIDFRSPIDEIQPRSARISPDGRHAVFTSVASPTPGGYDNRDANSGEPVQEVYLYDSVEDELRCVSCNPSGMRPTGEDIGFVDHPFYVAAKIQGWELYSHAPRVLSDDGTRVYFESIEALEPSDTNGNWDVYQWEELGKGTCEEGSDSFAPKSGGCIELISSGLSSDDSVFLDADASGDNVFIGTHSSLVKADPGLSDAYVARVGGGFPEQQKPAPCEGDACQSPPPPPPGVTPSTRTSSGPGNVPQGKARKRRCPKGKRRVKRGGKVRCVKRKRAAKGKRRARGSKTRRAGR